MPVGQLFHTQINLCQSPTTPTLKLAFCATSMIENYVSVIAGEPMRHGCSPKNGSALCKLKKVGGSTDVCARVVHQ